MTYVAVALTRRVAGIGGWRAFLPLLLAGLCSFAILHAGLPELRHDWRIPHGPDTNAAWIGSLFEGWSSVGIGDSVPYPTFYLIGFLLWPFQAVTNPFLLTTVIVFSTLFLVCRASMAIARTAGANPFLEVALGCFAVLNPWVYAKYVAGHLLMIVAYAIVLATVAETARPSPRSAILVILAAFAIVQIEFFAIAIVPLLVWTIKRGEYRAASAAAIAAVPIVYGIAASYGQVHATPFNLTWQEGQSVPALGALLLGGYQFGYGAVFDNFWLATGTIAAFAAVSVLSVNKLREWIIVCIALGAYLLSTGTKGLVAVPYTWAVEHFAEIGLFRELYDLLAIVAVGYVVVLARGLAKRRTLSIVLLIATGSCALPWIEHPPTTYFVPEARVAIAALPDRPQERVVLLPAFQPMQLGSIGSGVDPDAFVSSGRSLPINEAFPSFPVDVALGSLIFRGDDTALRGLSVTHIIDRPKLRTNFPTLRYQWLYADAPRIVCCEGSHTLNATPLLSLLRRSPALATIANQPLGDAVFFGDVNRTSIHGFDPTRDTIDPRVAWVDARLAFPIRPRWGTAFGGVTTASAIPLRLPKESTGTSLLAAAEGSLFDDRDRLISRSSALHWTRLGPDATSVRCSGTCIVVLQGTVPLRIPEQRPHIDARTIGVRFLRPWLATAVLPAGSEGTLRLNVRYDSQWRALVGNEELPHARLDTAFNAWRLPHTQRATNIVFVEWLACGQWVLEILAALAIATLVLLAFKADRELEHRVQSERRRTRLADF